MIQTQTTTDPVRDVRGRYADELAAGATVDAAAWSAVHFGEAACAAAVRGGLPNDALAWAEAAQALYVERLA